MPKMSASGILIEQPPEEIGAAKEDVIAVLTLVLVDRPAASEISTLLGRVLAAAYVRGVETGQRLAGRVDRRETERVE